MLRGVKQLGLPSQGAPTSFPMINGVGTYQTYDELIVMDAIPAFSATKYVTCGLLNIIQS